MKKVLLKLFQKKQTSSQYRKIVIGEKSSELMTKQLVSMERFGQPLIVAFK